MNGVNGDVTLGFVLETEKSGMKVFFFLHFVLLRQKN